MVIAFRSFLILSCLSIFIFSSCSKKEIVEVDNETQSSVDYAIADQEFMAIIPAVYQGLLATKGTGSSYPYTQSRCDSLSFLSGDTANFSPNPVYALNLSDLKCSLVMPDGKARSGNISVRVTGKVSAKETQVIVKLSDYVAGGISYSCDSIILTVKDLSGNNVKLNASLYNGVCRTGTVVIKYKFNYTIDLQADWAVAGSIVTGLPYGSASGTNRAGINFSTISTVESLVSKKNNCQYTDRGIVELTPEGFKTRKIDFGSGTCDNEATFTVNENTVAFKLK